MGNWVALILDRVLEQSGLVKGMEYQTQYTDRNDDGNLIRPDVIVNLPDKKHLIIDSKVSLVAYDRFINEEDEDEKNTYLKAHIESIRQHGKGLSEKNYLGASNLDVPDFILLFMPLESAFSLALQNDSELFNFAWERKIVIVSPTTLLATLKTVASLWKHEKQTRNAMEIAQRGGRLFDKFVAFLKDLEQIGNQISVLGKTYDRAHNKLSSGSGNLIRQAEMLRELGVKAEKSLPQNFTEDELPES
jgi:DNA recombination protein RmuC